MFPTVVLKPGKEVPLQRGHLWVFSGAVASISNDITEGDVVAVQSARGEHLGFGFYGSASIAVRMVSSEKVMPDLAFWVQRFQRALRLREVLKIGESGTNCFRLIHGEGDGIPGLIVDIYGTAAVIQPHHAGTLRQAEYFAEALMQLTSLNLDTIYLKASGTLQGAQDRWLRGSADTAVVSEHGCSFEVNWATGQKTGFFIDQRDNRLLLKQLAGGCAVLNTFSYTGGFSIAALAGGASSVHSVDVSAPALALAQQNAVRNGFTDNHEIHCADTLKYFQQSGDTETFDIVILDPPAYAKSMAKRHNAVMGYKRLNVAGMQKVKSGGLLFTFSCSQVVDRELFRHTIAAAGMESGRSYRILHELSQAADHPVDLFHPEGAYLKGLLLAVDD